MRSRLTVPLLTIEFLLAIEVCFTFWSEVGGQYDLDLMFWPWKFGLTLAAAGLITAITAEMVRGVRLRRMVLYVVLLVGIIFTAGIVTYYYYMNEPADDNGDAPTSQTTWLPLPRGRGSVDISSTKLGTPLRAPSVVQRCSQTPGGIRAYSGRRRWRGRG